MKKTTLFQLALFFCGLLFPAYALTAAQEAAPPARFYPYERGYPDRRPANIPVASFERGLDWYTVALTGVSKPYPPSLIFLDDQGGWYTPFNHPGMAGPYDLRGLHRAPLPAEEAEAGAVKKSAKPKSDKGEGMVGMSGIIAMSGVGAPARGAPVALPEARGTAGYCAVLSSGVIVFSAQEKIRMNSVRSGQCTLQESGVVVFNP